MQRAPHTSLAPVFVLAQLETLAQTVIDNAPATRIAFAPLAGTITHVKLTAPRLDVFIHIDPDAVIRLSHHSECPATLTIEGSAPALGYQFLQGGQLRAGGGIRIEGNPALALTLSQIARQLDFDWEDLISRYVGDVTAHQIGQVLRRGSGFLRDFARKAVRDSRTWLVAEKPMLVERGDFDHFRDDVHALRQDYERLEARVQRLKRPPDSGA